MKNKTLTTAKTKKKPAIKSRKASKSAKLTAKNTKSKKRARKAPFIGITKPYGFRIRADGTLETKEERAKRLARLEALTAQFFQMIAEDYHRK